MNIFDNIAKNVRKAQVPAVESLTESEIDGLAFAATTNEDYDTLGTAMEAMGVKTAYKEEKVDKDDLTEAEIRQLYDAGMEDEDPDDYEDPYTEETIIEGYIDEAYAEEADEALGELTEEDLEDIEDDEGMESYLSAEDFEDIAEEGFFGKIKNNKEAKEKLKLANKFISVEEKKIRKLLSDYSKQINKKEYKNAERIRGKIDSWMEDMDRLAVEAEKAAEQYADLFPIVTKIRELIKEHKVRAAKAKAGVYESYTEIAEESLKGDLESKVASGKKLDAIKKTIEVQKLTLNKNLERWQKAIDDNDTDACKECRRRCADIIGTLQQSSEEYQEEYANYDKIKPLFNFVKTSKDKIVELKKGSTRVAIESAISFMEENFEEEDFLALEGVKPIESTSSKLIKNRIQEMKDEYQEILDEWDAAIKSGNRKKMNKLANRAEGQLDIYSEYAKRYEKEIDKQKFLHPFRNAYWELKKLHDKKKEESKATESFEETGSEEDIAIESKLQRDRVKNAKQRKAFIDQQLKTLNTAIKIKQREIKAYRKEHKKDANYADRLEKLTTDMNDIIAKQTQYSKELAALNEVINMKGYTESEQARILQAKDAKAQRKLDHQELEYQAKLARQEDMYRREQDRLDKQAEMNFKRDMASDARNFMLQDHNADRQYNVEMNRLRTELEESRRNSAALAAETNKTIAELQALIEEQKKQALVQQEELLAAANAKQNEMLASVQTNVQNSLQTKNPFLKKFNQKVMDNFTNIMKAMSESQQAMNVAVASFCYGVNEEDVAEESALELVSAFIPTDEMECP